MPSPSLPTCLPLLSPSLYFVNSAPSIPPRNLSLVVSDLVHSISLPRRPFLFRTFHLPISTSSLPISSVPSRYLPPHLSRFVRTSENTLTFSSFHSFRYPSLLSLPKCSLTRYQLLSFCMTHTASPLQRDSQPLTGATNPRTHPAPVRILVKPQKYLRGRDPAMTRGNCTTNLIQEPLVAF